MVLRGRPNVKMKLAFSNKGWGALRSPYYLAVHSWNQLETDVQISLCKKDFRQKLNYMGVNKLLIGPWTPVPPLSHYLGTHQCSKNAEFECLRIWKKGAFIA